MNSNEHAMTWVNIETTDCKEADIKEQPVCDFIYIKFKNWGSDILFCEVAESSGKSLKKSKKMIFLRN